jgi:hypothetical protein
MLSQWFFFEVRRRKMNRRTFVTQGCACGALVLAGASRGVSETTTSPPAKDDYTHPVNSPQVMAVLTDESILLGGERCRTTVHLLGSKPQS